MGYLEPLKSQITSRLIAKDKFVQICVDWDSICYDNDDG